MPPSNDGNEADIANALATIANQYHVDPTLQLLVIEAEINPPGAAVTLYLPWGAVTGTLTSRLQFQKTIGGFLREEEPATDFGDEAETTGPSTHEVGVWAHLQEDARCIVGNQVVLHDALRVRLGDVTAWSIGPMNPA